MHIFFLIYMLKTALCLSVFYLFYRLWLSKETFHRFNRMVLIGLILVSLVHSFAKSFTELPFTTD